MRRGGWRVGEGGHLPIAGAEHDVVEHDLAMANVSPRPTVLACADRALAGPGRPGARLDCTLNSGGGGLNEEYLAQAGNRMRLSALRAHTKVTYKPIAYGKRLRRLRRLTAPGWPGPCRSAAAPARRPPGHLQVAARRSAPRPSASHRGG